MNVNILISDSSDLHTDENILFSEPWDHQKPQASKQK